MQARQAGAFAKVHQHSFYIILHMMSGGNKRIAVCVPHIFQPFIAQFSGGYLYGYTMLRNMRLRIEPDLIYRYIVCGAQVVYKLLITFRLPAPQLEIAMGNGKRKAGCMEQVGHYYRI